MTKLPDWSIETREIGKDGRAFRYSATPAEFAALAEELDLAACRSCMVEGGVRPLAKGRYLVDGMLTADVVQRCVVTLEPVAARIEQEIDIEFWPATDIAQASSTSFDALGGDGPEPIEGGRVTIGRLTYELLASALDPYPRAPGAALDAPSGDGDKSQPAQVNPFAALANFKPKPKP